ncbi:MAG: glutathione peroxidase [Candidatus Marinimicrobia bacterium]|nr:glutathione peroxidase [Candidatus Neomarinimicrobiota bacterium]
MSTFYDYEANALSGEPIQMSNYKGKVVLIVNTASKCGFTPQYEGLQKLHEKYYEQGLAILGFPCNQFGKQEPGDAETIKNDCLVNYGVSFQMFEKVKVNGEDAHPLFEYLKNELKGSIGKSIRWNFTKFLLDSSGQPIKRFSSKTTPKNIEKYIVELLESIEQNNAPDQTGD